MAMRRQSLRLCGAMPPSDVRTWPTKFEGVRCDLMQRHITLQHEAHGNGWTWRWKAKKGKR